MNDNIRAAIALVVGNVISAVVLFSIANWDGDQVAILNSIVNSALILIGLIFKQGQSEGPDVRAARLGNVRKEN